MVIFRSGLYHGLEALKSGQRFAMLSRQDEVGSKKKKKKKNTEKYKEEK